MTRGRLLYVINELGSTGAPASAARILGHVDRQATYVQIVALQGGSRRAVFEALSDGLVVGPHGPSYVWPLRARFRGVPLRWPGEVGSARRELARVAPDWLVVDTVVGAAWARAGLELGLRTGIILREPEGTLRVFGRAAGIEHQLCAASVVAVNSAATERAVRTVLGCSGPLRRITPEIDWGRRPAPIRKRKRRVVICGSVTRVKGADKLPALVGALASRLGDSTVDVRWVGDGPLRSRIVARSGRLPLRVQMVGPRESCWSDLAEAMVSVVMSREEPLSRAIIESLACETPVVAFDVGGVKEAMGPGGVLVSPGDVQGMADAVARLIADAAIRRELGSRGRDHVLEKFGPTVVREQARMFLREVGIPVGN